MAETSFINPLSFRSFLTLSHGAPLVFTAMGTLIDARTDRVVHDFSDVDFVIGFGAPPRLVSVVDAGHTWRVSYYDIATSTQENFQLDVPEAMELNDLLVGKKDGQDIGVFVASSEQNTHAFVLGPNGQLWPADGWTEKTVFGDFDLDFYVDQITQPPGMDIFQVRLRDGTIRSLDGRVLDVGAGLLLETFEAESAQGIRCHAYGRNGDLEPLWFDLNYVGGRIENADTVSLVSKVKGARQRHEIRAAASGAELWRGAEGHISFGLRQSDTVHVATVDTIDGVMAGVFHLFDGRRDAASPLCPPMDIRQDVLDLPFGGEALFLLPESPRGAVVSLHGGPESFEWSNLRYGGLYRDLLGDNLCVVIFNYTGSSESGSLRRTAGHRNFCNAVSQEFQRIAQKLASDHGISIDQISLFGGSFGATLALSISTQYPCATVAISSPMSDLFRHVTQTDYNPEYVDWFNCRFSQEDFEQFSLMRLSRSKAKYVSIFHGKDDEICRPHDTTELANMMIDGGKHIDVTFPDNTGHAPSDPDMLAAYLSWARAALLHNT